MTKITYGMVGGGEGAFIGGVHRIAAQLDDLYQLKAGCFSSNLENNRRTGATLYVDNDRVYDNYQQMAETESKREDGIQAVSIVTPNHLHAPVAKAFLKAGIAVICDKPLCLNENEALELKQLVETTKTPFFVTYNYSGNVIVQMARKLVESGKLGSIIGFQLHYLQDWLLTDLEHTDNKQAQWRTDPKRAGAGCLGDIGVHAFQLLHFITQQQPKSIFADVYTQVPGRALDDNALIILELANGAKGSIRISQTNIGHDNDLCCTIYGTEGALHWKQEFPEQLYFTPKDGATRQVNRNSHEFMSMFQSSCRTPSGHAEGYLEAFANIYRNIALTLNGQEALLTLPTFTDGLLGMQFISKAIESSQKRTWVHFN